MLDVRQIHPLTDFLRNHKAHIDRIKETHTPEILTVNGRAEVVVLEPGVFQELVARAERAELIEAIQEGIASADRGELKPAEQILAEIKVSSGRRQNFREAADATLEQYDEALKRLSQ